ncbi:hypothetical protein F4821DRAFT_257253 [Hypoxylon rubiginosum]|uniref:Uncharacterized protein n=1 Tax=Hypoxylon rubiginosum TaxID=110542 RepID=A0ACC0D9A7_9PEZI|nr:hypothetical protein F4821DRAFT_257253 [Hypoxylon rubiginosum]
MSTLTTIDALARWARLKKYRIEVTYGVYVFSPMEKVFFWSIFCFLFTVISLAAIVYTQRNVLLLIRYASVFIRGDGSSASGAVSNFIPKGEAAYSVARSGVTSLAETMGGAANSQVP